MAQLEIKMYKKTNKRLNWINDTRLWLILLSLLSVAAPKTPQPPSPPLAIIEFIGLPSDEVSLSSLPVLWPPLLTPPLTIDYKSVTGPVKLIVLVPLLVVMTFGVVTLFVIVVDILCLSSVSGTLLLWMLLLLLLWLWPWLLLLLLLLSLLFTLLLLLLLFNRTADDPVVMVTTLLLSNGCGRFCSDCKRYSRLGRGTRRKNH